IDNTLDSLITGLDPELFFRISRSCIVSKDSVESVTKLFGGRLKVASKVTFHNNPRPQPDLTVSRSRCEEFLTWLEK
ncbi:MAG: LytTR family transcriptional regulator, partial [Bacteroidales bacterium]|nr:LytTR family transcriptional regulator [Bacteroidales bacterium]